MVEKSGSNVTTTVCKTIHPLFCIPVGVEEPLLSEYLDWMLLDSVE